MTQYDIMLYKGFALKWKVYWFCMH